MDNNQNSDLTIEHNEDVTSDNQTVTATTTINHSVINMPDLNKIDDDNYNAIDNKVDVQQANSESASNNLVLSNVEVTDTTNKNTVTDTSSEHTNEIVNTEEGVILPNETFESEGEVIKPDEDVPVKTENDVSNTDHATIKEEVDHDGEEVVSSLKADKLENEEVDQTSQTQVIDETAQSVVMDQSITEQTVQESIQEDVVQQSIEDGTIGQSVQEEALKVEEDIVQQSAKEVIETQENILQESVQEDVIQKSAKEVVEAQENVLQQSMQEDVVQQQSLQEESAHQSVQANQPNDSVVDICMEEQGDEVIEQVIVPDQISEVSAIVNSFESSNDGSVEKVVVSPKNEVESESNEETLIDTSDNIEIITTHEACHDTDKILAEICGETVTEESLDTTNDSTNSSETFYITTESTSIDDPSKGKETEMTYYIVEEEVFVNPGNDTEIELKVAAAPIDTSNDNTAVKKNSTGKHAQVVTDGEDNIEEESIDQIRDTVDSTQTTGPTEKKKNLKSNTIKSKAGNIQIKSELKIPNHVLGRNVANPNLEMTRNGRPPKPRIGVKVPHRNLTSQIVSKQDITDVLLERQRAKSAGKVYGENTLFAKRLTKTLASRIVPPKQSQLKNSDLISILEGTEEEVAQTAKKKDVLVVQNIDEQVQDDSIETYTNDEFVKQIEQQLARKQLNELQNQKPNKRKRLDVKLIDTDEERSQIEEIVERTIIEKKGDAKPRKIKEDIIEVEVSEPKFKANVPVKTYGRKWKTNEPTSSEQVPPPPRSVIESDLNENQTIYITKKSSRVVKRKVIWDPDEAPVRLTTAKIIKIADKPSIKIEKSPVRIEKPQSSKSSPKLQTNNQGTEKVIIKQIEKAVVTAKSPRLIEKAIIKEKLIPKQEKIAIITKTIPSKMPIKREAKQVNLVQVKTLPNTKVKLKPGTPKKKLTEVDRLLMDEGAVNMLYSVKNEDVPVKKRKQSVISLDVLEKELRDKTNEILNDLQTNKKSAIMLRKKESSTPSPVKKANVPAIVSRQKSKDSTRSSIQSPPASPVFHQHAEASRIIRRHSSDSFSSEAEEEEIENESEKDVVVQERVTRSKVNTEDKQRQNEEMSKKFNKLIEADQSKIKMIEREAITVKYFNGFVNIVMKESENKVFLSVQSMKEICESLNDADDDETVIAVLFTSNGSSFCQGINYKSLLAEKDSTRKSLAKEMANTIKKFLLCLMKHSKILICGIHGDIVGLGVTILPLFDVIISSESTTFATTYGKYGCMPEGLSIVRPGQFLHKAFISELFYSSRILIAAEAYQIGLVTRVLCPNKFDEELLASVKQIAKQPPQFILSTKNLLLPECYEEYEEALSKECEQLISNWISAECQKNFANS